MLGTLVKYQQPLASETHDAVLTKAGFTRQETVETSSNKGLKTVTRYTKPSKDKSKGDFDGNVDVTTDSKSGETIWNYGRCNKDGSYLSDSGSSVDALKLVL